MFNHLTIKGDYSMLDRLEGWLPTSSRVIERGERVFIGDHSGLVSMHHARGLTISALSGRLSFCSRREAVAEANNG